TTGFRQMHKHDHIRDLAHPLLDLLVGDQHQSARNETESAQLQQGSFRSLFVAQLVEKLLLILRTYFEGIIEQALSKAKIEFLCGKHLASVL
ncbi:hypothetical protein PMAYCL1PPCAC_20589, partial [Pristionchus mayeri]